MIRSIIVKRLFIFCILFVTSILTTNSFAKSSSASHSNAHLKSELRKVSLQTMALQKEINELRAQLHKKQTHPVHGAANGLIAAQVMTYQSTAKSSNKSKQESKQLPKQLPKPESVSKQKKLDQEAAFLEAHHFWTIFRHPVTVTTSPFLGLRSAFNASDLLDQQSSMNEDLTLLEQRAVLTRALREEGYDPSRPIVEISGGMIGQAIYSEGTGGYSGSSSSVNLSSAELDVNAIASTWASTFFSLDYDDSPALTGSRVPNSRIYLRRGFLTIGNLNYSDFYFTIGQMYMPFGRYSSTLVTAPLTLSMARILDRGIILGFLSHGFYAQLYGYEGNQTTINGVIFKQGGLNLGVKRSIHVGSFDIGAGIVSNIADSEGMQNNATGSTTLPFFHGFGEEPSTVGPSNLNDLRHRVPAADVHGEFSLGRFALIAEFLSATEAFDPNDMTYIVNGVVRGARPAALHTEVDYNFHTLNRPVTIGVAYGESWNAFALNLPKRSIWALLQTSIWKDTVESIEYRHDINYGSNVNATGGFIPTGGIGRVPVQFSPGGSRNLVTAQIGVYF